MLFSLLVITFRKCLASLSSCHAIETDARFLLLLLLLAVVIRNSDEVMENRDDEEGFATRRATLKYVDVKLVRN